MENVQSLAVTLKVEGVPAIQHPSIGEDMSNGVVITEDNQKDYSTSFERYEGECSLLNLQGELMELSVNNDGTASLTFVKGFEDTSDEEIEDYVNGLSNVIIRDNVLAAVYTATVVGVEAYDIM